MQLKWYVLVTRPNWEKKVSERLTRSEITNYLPEIRKVDGHNEPTTEPLFTANIFIKISLTQQSLLKGIPGILKFAYWLGRPAIVQEEEIDTLKEFLQKNPSVTTRRIPVNFQDRRKLMKDLDKTKYSLTSNENRKSAWVILPSIGYVLIPKRRKSIVNMSHINRSTLNPVDNIYEF